MFQRYSAYFSWFAVLAAAIVWLSAGLFAWTIQSEETARTLRDLDTEYVSAAQDTALRLRALARDTQEERSLLDQLAKTDIAEIIDAVEKAGRDAGVVFQIGQALSAPPAETPLPGKTVSFFVSTEGTFSAVMHAARLLTLLPIPSLIEEIQFERSAVAGGTSGRGASTWRLGMRVRFLTTAEISS
jgi:hypothetical protein